MPELRFPEVPIGAVDSEPERGKGAARLAVLGDPIAHSRSPQLHLAAYRLLGVDWSYARWRMPAGSLATNLGARGQGWRGVSVTAPLKAEALAYAAEADEAAVLSGAANTLVFDTLSAGTPGRAFNTDISGIIGALAGHLPQGALGQADVLGAGGTAASAVVAAAQLGAAQVRVVARRPKAAADLAARLDGKLGATRVSSIDLAQWRPEADTGLVIDTIPGGCPVPVGIEPVAVPLLSAAYEPWPTGLAAWWKAAGGVIVPGSEMLLRQALVQVRLFTGRAADESLPNEEHILTAMRAALNDVP